jgi:hypothetical protein
MHILNILYLFAWILIKFARLVKEGAKRDEIRLFYPAENVAALISPGDTPCSMPAITENECARRKTNNIPNQESPGRGRMARITDKKAAAVKHMPPQQVEGNGKNKGEKQGVDNHGSGPGIDTENEGRSGKKLQKR